MITFFCRTVFILVIGMDFDHVDYPHECVVVAVHRYLDAFLFTNILDDVGEMWDGTGFLEPFAWQLNQAFSLCFLILRTFLSYLLCFYDNSDIFGIYLTCVGGLLALFRWTSWWSRGWFRDTSRRGAATISRARANRQSRLERLSRLLVVKASWSLDCFFHLLFLKSVWRNLRQ